MEATRMLVVTGLSGAGKSTAMRALEDSGWFCIDNLPVVLLPRLVDLFYTSSDTRRMALGVDAREGRYLGQAPATLEEARRAGHAVEVVFLDASDDALIRRFSETRRRHPLAPEGTVPEGIAAERARLAELRAVADAVIDTSALTVHELKHTITERFGAGPHGAALSATLLSFGYRHGIPPQADLVLDVRFLPNPYFVEDLRPLPGTDPRVSSWLLERPEAQEFLEKAGAFLRFLLPLYRGEGKRYLTVAIGCTGGRHRSVAMAEALAARLTSPETPLRARHRDVERE